MLKQLVFFSLIASIWASSFHIVLPHRFLIDYANETKYPGVYQFVLIYMGRLPGFKVSVAPLGRPMLKAGKDMVPLKPETTVEEMLALCQKAGVCAQQNIYQ
eukprot:gnl/Trimastix_PCT/4695.p1 GENE.gnl/Trimastix_PCT/4695~~gnl/Trimastix_PCT/4695.p1  ORF type:complete len:102 (+),score=3.75 gnl/Trimastix_PCT/4695:111-416(+)